MGLSRLSRASLALSSTEEADPLPSFPSHSDQWQHLPPYRHPTLALHQEGKPRGTCLVLEINHVHVAYGKGSQLRLSLSLLGHHHYQP